MVGVVVALVGVVVGVRAMSAPVQRTGEPTIAVPAPSGTRFTTPSATPTATGTESKATKSSPSASKAATPESTMKASGAYNYSTATLPAAGSDGKLYSYVVAVETTAKLKANGAARTIAGVLNDPGVGPATATFDSRWWAGRKPT